MLITSLLGGGWFCSSWCDWEMVSPMRAVDRLCWICVAIWTGIVSWFHSIYQRKDGFRSDFDAILPSEREFVELVVSRDGGFRKIYREYLPTCGATALNE
ncbi:hypothetical protein TSUD_150310 [Trifolium subterraneum]|uniref:Uncharacterized protein n=1 Tax=Trifolium subterraneum TaxID=3900 RepID=A0A2Z6NM79_TRISU|nr:hypothetical protein TSUD_150310 [Trifolium subterraneum]